LLYFNSQFATAIQFHHSLIFAGKAWSPPSEWQTLKGSTLEGSGLVPRYKSKAVANTPAYYNTATVMVIKSFIFLVILGSNTYLRDMIA